MKNKQLQKCIYAFLQLLIKIIIFLLILHLISAFLFSITKVKGMDMYPKISDGDLILYNKFDKQFVNGDVIVYEENKILKIARIIAIEGDEVDINETGELSINNNTQNENIFYKTFKHNSFVKYPYIVNDNSYFVLGDNRENSYDSRDFGCISCHNIKGKVISIMRIRGI